MLPKEIRSNNFHAMIVRSADFYGPGALQSFVHAVFFERLRAGKSPQLIGNLNALHTCGFTRDAGQAVDQCLPI